VLQVPSPFFVRVQDRAFRAPNFNGSPATCPLAPGAEGALVSSVDGRLRETRIVLSEGMTEMTREVSFQNAAPF